MIFNISRYFSAITNRFTNISTEYAEDMFLFDSILSYCDLGIDVSNTYFSRLKNNNSEVDGSIRDAIQRDDVIKHVLEYFSNMVVPKLNPHTGLDSCTDIIRFMNEDATMNERTREKYVKLYENEKYGEFLANTFLYALSRKNKISKNPEPEYLDSNACYLLLNKIHNNTEMLMSKSFINIDSDLSLALSNQYDLSYTAKKKEDAFSIVINVSVDSIPRECSNFKSLLDFIMFSGKAISLKVYDITVYDSHGNKIDYIFNSLMVVKTVTLPTIHSMRYDKSDFRSCPAELTIKSMNNTKMLELRNDFGEVILPFMSYQIERNQDKDSISAHFVTYENEYLNIGLHFQRPKRNCDIKDHQTTITVTLKNPNSTKCNIQYYELLTKLNEATGSSFFQKDGNSSSEFIHTQGFTPTYKDGAPIHAKDYLDLFKEFYYIENILGIEFDVSEFSKENIYYAQLLYRLLKDKKVITKEQVMTVDYDPNVMNNINLEGIKDSPIMVDCEFTNISVFNQFIEFKDKYHMRWFSKNITLLPDNKAQINAYATVIYELGQYSEEELQAFGIEENTY